MKQDLSCPIELQGCTLSYSESAVLASVCLYNRSARRIASFEAVLKWRSSASGRSIAAPQCVSSLRARGLSPFTVTLSNRQLPDADRMEILFTVVQFDNGDTWRMGSGDVVEIAPIDPALGDDRIMLSAVAGPDAICYPRQDSHAWRCVCGRVNLNSEDACERCHRSHFAAIGFTPENVRFHYEALPKPAAQVDRETIAHLQESYLRQHARRFRRVLTMAVAALALTALIVLTYPGSSAPDSPAQAAVQEQ